MGQLQPLFSIYFRSFQTNLISTNACEKCSSSIRYRYSNSRPFDRESPPITTWPGLPPYAQIVYWPPLHISHISTPSRDLIDRTKWMMENQVRMIFFEIPWSEVMEKSSKLFNNHFCSRKFWFLAIFQGYFWQFMNCQNLLHKFRHRFDDEIYPISRVFYYIVWVAGSRTGDLLEYSNLCDLWSDQRTIVNRLYNRKLNL